jgi:hypothetical protein
MDWRDPIHSAQDDAIEKWGEHIDHFIVRSKQKKGLALLLQSPAY